jgi:hypothetical protein
MGRRNFVDSKSYYRSEPVERHYPSDPPPQEISRRTAPPEIIPTDVHHDETRNREEDVDTHIATRPGDMGGQVSKLAMGNIKQSMVRDHKPRRDRSKRLEKMQFHYGPRIYHSPVIDVGDTFGFEERANESRIPLNFQKFRIDAIMQDPPFAVGTLLSRFASCSFRPIHLDSVLMRSRVKRRIAIFARRRDIVAQYPRALDGQVIEE